MPDACAGRTFSPDKKIEGLRLDSEERNDGHTPRHRLANLNIHLHFLALDGVYRRTERERDFREARAPTGAELEGLLDKIIVRLLKMLTRQRHLVEEQGVSYIADIDEDNPLASLQAASCTYRIALGPRADRRC